MDGYLAFLQAQVCLTLFLKTVQQLEEVGATSQGHSLLCLNVLLAIPLVG